MGHEKKEAKNKYGIRKGMVEEMKAELAKANYVPTSPSDVVDRSPGILVEDEKNKSDDSSSKGLSENDTEEKNSNKFNYLTKSRPSRSKLHKPTLLPSPMFFSENDDKNVFAGLLKQAISKADNVYHEKILREPKGWLTDWRHGKAGLDRAEIFSSELQKVTSVATIMIKLNEFFERPDVKYNHNSFPPFLLDTLNELVEKYSLPSCRPKPHKHYNADFWPPIAKQLRKIIKDKLSPIDDNSLEENCTELSANGTGPG